MKCPGCGFNNTFGDKFCGECGAPLSDRRNPGLIIADRYKILEVKGSDPGGWLYKAQSESDQKLYRIREIRIGNGISPRGIQRAARKLMSLPDSLFLRREDNSESVFLIFQWREGMDLSALTNHGKNPADLRRGAEIFVRILNFLKQAHTKEEQVVFGDISPFTFGVDDKGSLFLNNCGTGICLDGSGLKRFVKPGFIAPEVFIRDTFSSSSDIFSAAAVLYHLLTGMDPCKDRKDPYSFSALNDGLSVENDEARNLLRSMLREDQSRRFTNIDAITKKTEAILGKQSPAMVHVTRGISDFNMGKYKKSLEEFKNAVLYDPELPTAYYWQGRAFSSMGKMESALKSFDLAVSLDPEYGPARYQKGMTLIHLDKNRDALREFDILLSVDDKDISAHLGKALALRNLDRLEEAEKAYDSAIKTDRFNPDAYLFRGLTRYDLGRIRQAIDDYNKALEIEPRHAFALLGRGLAKSAANDLNGALKDLDSAVGINPGYAAAYLERAIILISFRMYETALLDLDKSIKLDPSNPESYFQRGKARNRLGDYQGSVKDLDKAVNMDSELIEAYKIRAESKQRMGDLSGAGQDEQKYKLLFDLCAGDD